MNKKEKSVCWLIVLVLNFILLLGGIVLLFVTYGPEGGYHYWISWGVILIGGVNSIRAGIQLMKK